MPWKKSAVDINDMVDRRLNGETLRSIGERYGVSRERVRQLCEKHGLIDIANDLARQATQERKVAAKKAKVERREARFGVSDARLRDLRKSGITRRYNNFVQACRRQDVECTLSLADYADLVEGKQCGRKASELGVSRIDKTKGFVPGNVTLIPHAENSYMTQVQAYARGTGILKKDLPTRPKWTRI